MADSRLIKPFPKPLQLRDYLLDDMSSCSSNGFKSFPRKSQCCTTVRFLHEFDRKSKIHHHQNQKLYLNFNRPPPKPALSALQTVIAAVKRIQFPARSPDKKKSNASFLPRSFSRKILMKSAFWRRKSERKEIVRWKSFDQLLKEDPEPSDRSITTAGSKSKRWSGSDFTATSDSGNLNLPEESKEAVTMAIEVVSVNGVGVTNGDVSTDSTTSINQSADSNSPKKQWSSEEKEQFSPVSVLDCPFDDEEEDEVCSPFQHRLDRMEGTKKKLLKKITKFECLAKLEPVNLNTRFALQPDSSDTESSNEEHEDEEEEEEEEEKAIVLLRQTKASMPSYPLKLKADNLLLHFFRERIATGFHEGLIEEAEDWINGKPRGSFIEWGVQKNRESYIRDMEKGGEWKALDQETEEVVFELENEVFSALLNEVLLHIGE